MILRLLIGLLCLTPFGSVAETLNVSNFVFRDLDGDGIYENEDQPFAGATILATVGEERIAATSNLNGFGNFLLGVEPSEADFFEAGEGKVTYVAPAGMFVSTAYPEAAFEVRPVKDSIAGLVVDPPLPFLGLAIEPQLVVYAPGAVSLACRGSEDLQNITFDNRGIAECGIPVEQASEAWDLTVSFGDSRTVRHEGIVPGFRKRIMAFSAQQAPQDRSQRDRVTFDTVLRTRDVREMPALENGLRFHNFVVAHRRFYGGNGYVNALTSGEYLAYTSSGHPGTISREGGFVPVSMELGYAWPGARGGHAIIEAYRDDHLVHQIKLTLSTDYPVTFMPSWGRVDRLVIRHSSYWQVLIDDFVYQE